MVIKFALIFHRSNRNSTCFLYNLYKELCIVFVNECQHTSTKYVLLEDKVGSQWARVRATLSFDIM